MKPRSLILVAIAGLSLPLVHAKDKKLQVPEVFQSAHSVYVECTDGELSRPGLRQADREAILQVQEALREWGRYVLVPTRDKADFVIVLRKGHAVGDQDHLGLGLHPSTPQPLSAHPGERNIDNHLPDQTASVGNGGDDIAMQDMLRVYTLNEKGKLKGPVWSREMDGGLNGPTVRLLMELKAAVEITYPRDAASPQTAAQPAP